MLPACWDPSAAMSGLPSDAGMLELPARARPGSAKMMPESSRPTPRTPRSERRPRRDDQDARPSPSVRQIREQGRAQIALTEGRHDDHDELPGILLPPRDLHGGPDGGAGRDAHQQAFFASGATGRGKGILVLHLDDLVVDPGVEHVRHEPGPDALDRMRPLRPAGENGGGGRLDGYALERWLTRPDHLADAGDRPAGADSRDQNVRCAVGVPPDLLGRRLPMDLGGRRILELL